MSSRTATRCQIGGYCGPEWRHASLSVLLLLRIIGRRGEYTKVELIQTHQAEGEANKDDER